MPDFTPYPNESAIDFIKRMRGQTKGGPTREAAKRYLKKKKKKKKDRGGGGVGRQKGSRRSSGRRSTQQPIQLISPIEWRSGGALSGF